nr:zinc finger protein 26 [Aedes albopictus]
MMNFEQICRLCATENAELTSISGDERHARLPEQLCIMLQIQYDENDGLPQKVCASCVMEMDQMQVTWDKFRSNDVLLRQQLLGFEEIEVKDEELTDCGSALVTCSSQNGSMEVLEHHDEQQTDHQNEEWLEEDSIDEDDLITQDGGSDCISVIEEAKLMQTFDFIASSETMSLKKKRGRPKLTEEQIQWRKEAKISKDLNRTRLNDFSCYICKCKQLESAKALLDHLSEHSDMLPYTCKICVQETVEIKQMRSLNIHLRMHEQPLKCPYCDRRYAEQRAREYHVRTYHLGDNVPCPSTCDICGTVCASVLALRTHMKRHTHSYTCDICGKAFAQNSKLKRHVTRVHENTSSHECKICQKRLKTIDAYELHMRTIHDGRRDFECQLCGHRFTTAAFLRMHQKQSQDGTTCKPRNNWRTHYSTRINAEGTKVFCCSICSKEFTRSIAEHLRTHFPIEYECPICLAKLPNKTSFDRHRLQHNEIAIKCISCKKSFLTERNLANHMAKIHGIGEEIESSSFPMLLDDDIEYDVEG